MFKIFTRTTHITLLALAIVLVSAFGFTAIASAQGDVCPSGGSWVKVEGINAQSYTYTAPSGKLIVETCYKAGTTLVYNVINPGVSSITVTSTVWNPTENNYQNISHASFRLADPPTPTPTQPTPTQPTPTQPTPTQPTPTQPTPTQPTPTQPPVIQVTPQSTPAPVIAPATGSPSGPGTLITAASSVLGLSGISLGIWLKRRKM
ncbi:MAG: hypothetical protein K0B06_07890 [Brevefilum sp.]|nr:hypothetical protein [Brevefilum sp.]